MATIIEFTAPAEEFPLGSIFETFPEVNVELERLIPHTDLIIPYFWVRGAEIDDIEAAFAVHTGVTNIKQVDSVDSEYLMRAEWEREYVGVLTALAETNIVVLSAIGRKDGWRFEVRGESRSVISEFQTYCKENDIPIDIIAIHALIPIMGDGYGLTETQREALVVAYQRGYFNTPREATLEDVAKEFGITQQSLSSRLRRGHRRLIADTLIGS